MLFNFGPRPTPLRKLINHTGYNDRVEDLLFNAEPLVANAPWPLGVVDTRGVVRFRSRDTLFLNEDVQEAANVISDLRDLFSLEAVDEFVIEKLAVARV